MPIDTDVSLSACVSLQNVIEQKEVAADIFACLYQRQGLFKLRLCHAEVMLMDQL